MKGNPHTTEELPEGVWILINKDALTESNLCLMKVNVFRQRTHVELCAKVCITFFFFLQFICKIGLNAY